jgi:hypothetical protein
MYTVHKKERRQKAIEFAASQTDGRSPDELTNNNKVEKQMNGSAANHLKLDNEFSSRLNHRLGSIRKMGVTNNGFANDEADNDDNNSRVLSETLEIVKDLPAFHLEHCKL